jgi:hypothetical protein
MQKPANKRSSRHGRQQPQPGRQQPQPANRRRRRSGARESGKSRSDRRTGQPRRSGGRGGLQYQPRTTAVAAASSPQLLHHHRPNLPIKIPLIAGNADGRLRDGLNLLQRWPCNAASAGAPHQLSHAVLPLLPQVGPVVVVLLPTGWWRHGAGWSGAALRTLAAQPQTPRDT